MTLRKVDSVSVPSTLFELDTIYVRRKESLDNSKMFKNNKRGLTPRVRLTEVN